MNERMRQFHVRRGMKLTHPWHWLCWRDKRVRKHMKLLLRALQLGAAIDECEKQCKC